MERLGLREDLRLGEFATCVLDTVFEERARRVRNNGPTCRRSWSFDQGPRLANGPTSGCEQSPPPQAAQHDPQPGRRA
jgi:hypothetical protein